MLRRAAPMVVLIVALATFAAAWWHASRPALRAPASAAVDLLPLWLGAGLVLDGGDPTDPALAEARFRAEALPLRPGGFYAYYPPTASLLASPLRLLPFRDAVALWRWVCALATPVGVGCAVLAGFATAPAPRPRSTLVVALSAAALIAALAVTARPARIVLPTAQPGPLVVLATGAALLAIGSGRTRGAAAVAAVGAALKLLPGVILPILVLRRQWGATAVAGGVLAGLVLALCALGVPLHPLTWTSSLVGFVGRGPLPSWNTEPAWVQVLWQVRVPVASTGLVAAAVVAVRRGLSDATALDLSALAIASVAFVLAGSHHYHEALLLLPAFAHVLAWPAQAPRSRLGWVAAAALLVGCGLSWPAFAPRGRPDGLAWVGIGSLAWAGCFLRVCVGDRVGSRWRSARVPVS